MVQDSTSSQLESPLEAGKRRRLGVAVYWGLGVNRRKPTVPTNSHRRRISYIRRRKVNGSACFSRFQHAQSSYLVLAPWASVPKVYRHRFFFIRIRALVFLLTLCEKGHARRVRRTQPGIFDASIGEAVETRVRTGQGVAGKSRQLSSRIEVSTVSY